eukprot:518619-Prymnesium_polylepis.1
MSGEDGGCTATAVGRRCLLLHEGGCAGTRYRDRPSGGGPTHPARPPSDHTRANAAFFLDPSNLGGRIGT